MESKSRPSSNAKRFAPARNYKCVDGQSIHRCYFLQYLARPFLKTKRGLFRILIFLDAQTVTFFKFTHYFFCMLRAFKYYVHVNQNVIVLLMVMYSYEKCMQWASKEDTICNTFSNENVGGTRTKVVFKAYSTIYSIIE